MQPPARLVPGRHTHWEPNSPTQTTNQQRGGAYVRKAPHQRSGAGPARPATHGAARTPCAAAETDGQRASQQPAAQHAGLLCSALAGLPVGVGCKREEANLGVAHLGLHEEGPARGRRCKAEGAGGRGWGGSGGGRGQLWSRSAMNSSQGIGTSTLVSCSMLGWCANAALWLAGSNCERLSAAHCGGVQGGQRGRAFVCLHAAHGQAQGHSLQHVEYHQQHDCRQLIQQAALGRCLAVCCRHCRSSSGASGVRRIVLCSIGIVRRSTSPRHGHVVRQEHCGAVGLF